MSGNRIGLWDIVFSGASNEQPFVDKTMELLKAYKYYHKEYGYNDIVFPAGNCDKLSEQIKHIEGNELFMIYDAKKPMQIVHTKTTVELRNKSNGSLYCQILKN